VALDPALPEGTGRFKNQERYFSTPLRPYAPLGAERFVRVVRQGAPSQAQRKVLDRALEMGRDDETRRRPL